MRNKAEILEWEGRWFVPAGLATLAGVALVIASAFAIGAVSGDGDAELLRSAHEHSSSVNLAAALQAAGFVFLVAPLLFLFKATAARSGRVRTQLIGLVIAAPLFLSVAAVLNAVATDDAGNAFVAGTAKPGITVKEADKDCRGEQKDKGAKEFGEEYGGANPAGGAASSARRPRSPTRKRPTRSAKPRPMAPPSASASAVASASPSPSSTPASTRCGSGC